MRILPAWKSLRFGVGLLLGILAVPSLLVAANHYVRAGATGNGSGTDWTNAYTDLPASLVRGDTYYIAAGSYVPYGHTFNDPESGTSVITLKTATQADHGTDTGWSSSYAGQVVFGGGNYQSGQQGILEFDTGYYVLNGVYRSGWESGYGMKVSLPPISTVPSGSTIRSIWVRGDGGGRNITLKYIDIGGYGQWNTTFIHQYCVYHIEGDYGYGGDIDSWTIDHCYLHDTGEWSSPMLTDRASNWLIQYTEFARNTSISSFHSEGWSARGDSPNITFRYNRMVDINGSGEIVMLSTGTGYNLSNWKIYGNYFWIKTPGQYIGDGVIACMGSNTCSDVYIYNNTFANFQGTQSGNGINWYYSDASSSNVNAYDNLWYNCTNVSMSGSASGQITHDYNYFISDTGVPSETHIETGSTDPFVDLTNGDFHLTSETKDGKHFSSPYDVDPDGVKRGSDNNIWSRGAYQYAPNSSSPDPPSNLAVSAH